MLRVHALQAMCYYGLNINPHFQTEIFSITSFCAVQLLEVETYNEKSEPILSKHYISQVADKLYFIMNADKTRHL
jgi:hypothetical protein